MNAIKVISRFSLTVICLLGAVPEMNGQLLKKLGKAAERAAERTVERRVEQETQEKTDQALDSIFESGKKEEQHTDGTRNPVPPSDGPDETSTGTSENTDPGNQDKSSSESGSQSMAVYSKFDFVPGDKLLFFDDFSNDFIGDFPSKWNSNSSGELVQVNDAPDKWLKILPGFNSRYIPDVTDLPEEFTMEFDLMTTGLNKKTSSVSYLAIIIGDNNSFDKPINYGMIEYPFCQFIDRGIIVENNINGVREIRNTIAIDVRDLVLKKHHISIAVNQQRFRMWANERKVVDIPRLLPANVTMNGIKFGLRGLDTNIESIYLANFKIAEGGVDLRRKLISEGKISTNGILFDSGSANIQPQSMGIIRQISQVLQQESGINLQIVGHTDGDGNDNTNLELSQKRADAVKNTLVTLYGISTDRLTTEGKGESVPVGDNDTADGKAQNRRVEFIRQ